MNRSKSMTMTSSAESSRSRKKKHKRRYSEKWNPQKFNPFGVNIETRSHKVDELIPKRILSPNQISQSTSSDDKSSNLQLVAPQVQLSKVSVKSTRFDKREQSWDEEKFDPFTNENSSSGSANPSKSSGRRRNLSKLKPTPEETEISVAFNPYVSLSPREKADVDIEIDSTKILETLETIRDARSPMGFDDDEEHFNSLSDIDQKFSESRGDPLLSTDFDTKAQQISTDFDTKAQVSTRNVAREGSSASLQSKGGSESSVSLSTSNLAAGRTVFILEENDGPIKDG